MKRKTKNEQLAPLQPIKLTNPDTQKPFPMELSAADWVGFAKKLEEALKDKSGGTQLSTSERERFEKNVELIRRVKTAEEVRNYAMLEIHETKQWRADFRNVQELAASFNISRGHFYKAVKSAEINIQMAQAGLYHLRPTGRDVEKLGMLDREHRVEAWSYALTVAGEKGGSKKIIERALEDFSERLKGKCDTGLLKEDLVTVLPVEATTVESERHSQADFRWISNLDEIEEKVFECLISIDTWFATLKDPAMSHGSTTANLLTSLAIDFIKPSGDVDNMRDAIRLAVSKNRQLKRGFYHLGLYLIAEFLNQNYRSKFPRQP